MLLSLYSEGTAVLDACSLFHTACFLPAWFAEASEHVQAAVPGSQAWMRLMPCRWARRSGTDQRTAPHCKLMNSMMDGQSLQRSRSRQQRVAGAYSGKEQLTSVL